MKKELIALFVVFLLLILAGCKDKEDVTTVTGKAFVGGSQGLELSFLSGMPPSEVFDTDNPFQVGVKVENKGEHDISANEAVVSITGIYPSDFGVSAPDLTKSPEDDLKGVSIDGAGNVVSGDYTTIDFPEMNYVSIVAGSVPFTIKANVCYEYGTRSQGKLCLKKDLRGVTGEAGVCNPDRQVPAENSGAPVQIANFRQNVAGSNKIDFFFTIRKAGGAADTLHKKGTSCGSEIADRDIVYIEVSETKLGDLKCSGLKDGTPTSGYVTLFNNEREIRCSQTIEIDNLDDFEKVVEISLEYGYKQFIDKQLTVKHAT